MRQIPNKAVEEYRVLNGPLASDASYGNNGLFAIECGAVFLWVIISDGAGWEHASVSLRDSRNHNVQVTRTPTWEEMKLVKDMFWQSNETVAQYHPAASEYVNTHPYCLHLWRKIGDNIELPPKELVG